GRAGAAGNAMHWTEQVRAPWRPADVELIIEELADRVEATLPALGVELVADDPVGLDGGGHPSRVSQRRAVFDADGQCAARVGTSEELVDVAIEIRWYALECVEQEFIGGDLGRRPVELRVDRSHPGRHV